MAEKLNALALGYTGAILGAACMLVITVLAKIGIYEGLARLMEELHLFFSMSLFGILAGAIEAAVWGFVSLYVLGWLYNKLA